MSHKILALWATPRSTSTAFEWMMRQRGDFLVEHEPFGEGFYYGEDRRSRRDADVPARPGLDYASVWRSLRAQAARQPLFIKEFPHYIRDRSDADFLSHFRHSFLIRDPAKSLPGIFHKWPDFTLEETGYVEQHALFERITELDGRAPPVMESGDLLRQPEAMVKAYCAAVDIPFIAEALTWDPGTRKEVSWYDGGSWHGHLRQSRGFEARETSHYVSIDADPHLKRSYEACRPHYEALYAHRLRIA